MENGRFTIALLLLLAFAGQSLVVVSAPCSMMAGGVSVSSTDIADAAHAGHRMHGDPASDADATTDCCDGGYCSISGCSSLMALADVPFPATFAGPDLTRDASPASLPNTPPSFHFRPPISG